MHYQWRSPITDAEMVESLAPFYFDACGFKPTTAGLIHLYSLNESPGASR